MAHANARLTPAGRLTLVGRIAAQPLRPIAHIAHEMGISRTTAYRWWTRYQQLGQAGLVDRPSIPTHSPRRTPAHLEQRILRLRRRERLGPARIAARLALPASTVHRVLVRHQMNRLGWLDRPTGRPIRRYEHPRPGDLVHLDVKKLGRIPAGGGHRVHGRATGTVNRRADRSSGGYDYLHAAVDDHSRLAYVEVLGDERAQSCARFWRRAHHWFALHGITVHRVLTDNGVGYRSRLFGTALASTGVRHQRTRPYRPQTNGKVERFNRTLLEEWAYQRLYRSNAARDRALQPWVHRYNITAPTPPSVAGHRSAASTTSLAITPRPPARARATRVLDAEAARRQQGRGLRTRQSDQPPLHHWPGRRVPGRRHPGRNG
jgi:transposase InsO family protein